MINDNNFNTQQSRPRILVAPLDWGLGHATRCIPIIFKLIQQNCEVFIAAEGAIKILLQKEFPRLGFIELKGYRMQYSRNRSWMPVSLLLQFPKLISRIYAENRWLKKVVDEYKIDAVISDNRLGLSHKKIPCQRENPLTVPASVTIMRNAEKIRPAKASVVGRRKITAFGYR